MKGYSDMDGTNGQRRANEQDDLDFNARWPKRPGSAEPGESADGDNTYSGDEADGETRPAKWTSTPTSYKGKPNDPKETLVLPVVEPSRFDNGRRPVAAPGSSLPGSQSRQPQPARVQRPQQRPYDSHAGEYYPEYDASPDGDTLRSKPVEYSVPAYEGFAAPPVQPQVPTRTRPKRRWIGWVLGTLGTLIGIVLIGLVAFSLAWQGQYAGKIYAGVSVLDKDLSGKTEDDAKKVLRDQMEAFVAQPVVLAWRGKEWRPSADQLGLKVDLDNTVNEAFKVGRSQDMAQNISQQWIASRAGYRVPLTVQLSEPTLEAYLRSIAETEIDQKLFEGDVRLNGTQIEAKPGKEGRTLNIYSTILAVRDQVSKVEAGKVELPVEIVQPTVSAEEVQYIEGLLGIRISGPITATLPGKTLTLDREAIVRFTTIERNPDRAAERHVELGWKENELKTLADKWVGEANRAAQNARFAWNNGAVAVLTESIDGFQTDASTVMASIKEHAGTSDKREYEMPGKVIAATVSSKDLGALGIKELMGTGVSTFKGSSAERATNIKVAAGLLNGAVVPPGGTFSFLQAMGGIDEQHGFVEGYVIAAERTQRGVGGGVCQVSTTAFRAAFWSGLHITERNQHSYRVGWYEANGEPVGFDAAVFDPGVDLKFVNDTQGYVLVEALAGADTLTINMYGTKVPGQVKLEGPAISNRVPPPPDVYQVDPRLPAGTKKQVETARGGLDTVITRRIVVPGQPDKVDQFHSSYAAWPNWFIVAGQSQIPGGGSPPLMP
ncbi:MAG TPA: VanW family protein [Chloroflexia bacterium]|nr:VanW family protein [Chloroflexia bacterium]